MAPIAPLKIIVAPAAKAITKIGSTMTYDDVPASLMSATTAALTWDTSPTLRPSSPLHSTSATVSITSTIAAVILAAIC